MGTVADVAAAVFLLAGTFLAFAAGIGIVRFPDLLARMHAATKPQVLGLVLVLIAVALRVRAWSAVGMLLLVVVFQLLTAPVAAHMVGRSGLRTGKVPPGALVVDDLTTDQRAADAEEAADSADSAGAAGSADSADPADSADSAGSEGSAGAPTPEPKDS